MPERLVRVAAENRNPAARQRQLLFQQFLERHRRLDLDAAQRDQLRKVEKAPAHPLQCCCHVLLKRSPRHPDCDKGVAVAITTNPRRIGERRPDIMIEFRIMPMQRSAQSLAQCRCPIEQCLTEEIKSPGHFAFDARLFEADFSRQPE